MAMTALLPATALPGLLVPGALVRHPMDKAPHRVLDDGTVAPPWNGRTGDPPSPFVVLDLRDRASRCIAATALAVALGLDPGETAPDWWWFEAGSVWRMDAASGTVVFSATEPTEHRYPKRPVIRVPGLPAGPEHAAEALAMACIAVGKAGR